MIVSMPCCLEQRDEGVDRIGLVVEVDVGGRRRRDDAGRALERHPDDADVDAREAVDRVRREDRLAGVLVGHVGGEELEVGAREAVAAEAALDGMAAAVLHAGQLGRRPRRTRGCRRRCSRGR